MAVKHVKQVSTKWNGTIAVPVTLSRAQNLFATRVVVVPMK